MARLGVNIEKVAELRGIGGQAGPDPVSAAVFAEVGGSDGIHPQSKWSLWLFPLLRTW